jgi:ABC-type Fe3+ transport system substrate-binding protein
MFKVMPSLLVVLIISLLMQDAGVNLPEARAATINNPKLNEMIKKASVEGEIVYQGPDPATGSSTQDMIQDMAAVTEKYFGVKVRIKVDNALTFPASTAKTVTEIKAGAPPTFDLMYQTDMSGVPLLKEKALEQIPWRELFSHITAKDLEWNGVAIVNTNYVLAPAFNSSIVKAQDVPKTWDDILNPKWRGKISLVIVPEPWVMFAQPGAWGEEKTFAYLNRLMQLQPQLGRYPEVLQRLTSGETPLAWISQRERTLSHKESLKAPVDVAQNVEPVLVQTNLLLVPKGARRSNAAALVAGAMLTKEGQELQLKYQNLTSMFRPNTPTAEYVRNQKVIKMDGAFFIEKGPELMKKVAAILIKK